jgi:hypothetical protein
MVPALWNWLLSIDCTKPGRPKVHVADIRGCVLSYCMPQACQKSPQQTWFQWTLDICQLTQYASHVQDSEPIRVLHMYASLFIKSSCHSHYQASTNHYICPIILAVIVMPYGNCCEGRKIWHLSQYLSSILCTATHD